MLVTFFITLLGSLLGSFGGLLLAAYFIFKYGYSYYSKLFPKPENGLATMLSGFMNQPKTSGEDDDLIDDIRGESGGTQNPPDMMDMIKGMIENPDSIKSMLANFVPPQIDQKKTQ